MSSPYSSIIGINSPFCKQDPCDSPGLRQDIPSFQILPFDDQADLIYKTMPAAVRRLGRADCRIAASAIAHDYTVVTRNTRDFGQIPNVKFEDWPV